MRVEVVAPDPKWRSQFEAESSRVAIALASLPVQIHHIGSTAIPGIYAKPIIDLLIAVKVIASIDYHNDDMAAIGYEAMGEFGIPGRRYFRKQQGDTRTHHVHIFQVDSPDIKRHLAFRDYLIAHPDLAQDYSELKRTLAQQYPNDIQAYMDGKNPFIRAVERQALDWQTHPSSTL